MKPFHFRLETLLKLRERHEDEKKRVVGDLLAQLNTHQQQAIELAQVLRLEGQKLKSQYQSGHVDLLWVRNYQSFVIHTQIAIQKRIETVKQIQIRLNLARQELAHAAQQTRILEKLKEKQKQRHQRQQQRIDVRELDELGASMFLRSRYLA